MRVVLGLITRNEISFLQRHLPVITDCFDGIIAIDAESTDGSVEFLQSHGATVVTRKWDNDYSAARNTLIEHAESAGCDWIFMLDADECMFPDEIRTVRKYMNNCDFIALPRIEFVKDFNHFDFTLYPDYQGRVFKLGIGYRFRRKIHEMVHRPNDETPMMARPTERLVVPNCHIYHYGRCKPAEHLWLKYHNYDLLMKDKPLLDKIPNGVKINEGDFWKSCVKFYGPQPVL